ncbi:MAG TPA: ubiquitin-like domain-containing protein, partial [Candidatus Saccharimonadales bacterium]|nr:ubiquitin-like domain-containing protein [Candidatus Saccharimonadales bacterium]
MAGLGSSLLSFKNLASADSSKIVRVFADGKAKTFQTEAATVGEVLERMDLELDRDDLVEPGASTAVPAGFFNINVYRAQPYRIAGSDRELTVRSAHRSIRQVVEAAGIKLYPEDEVTAAVVQDFVATPVIGQNITIKRAVPVILKTDGQTATVRTHVKTVRDMLTERKVALGAKDSVSPALEAAVRPGLSVSITRVSQAVVTETEAVPRPVKTIQNPDQLRGTQTVRDEGKDGSRLVTYEIVYHNGQEKTRKRLKVADKDKPVAKVVVTGTKVVVADASDDVWYRLRLCES